MLDTIWFRSPRFFRRFFCLPENFLEDSSRPSDEEIVQRLGPDPAANVGTIFSDQLIAPLAPGSMCKTPAGVGKVKSFAKSRGVYEVELSYATGFIHKSNVERIDQVPAAGEAASSSSSDGAAQQTSASPKSVDEQPSLTPSRLPFLGNKHMYLYLKAHHILYSRLLSAKRLCQKNANKPKNLKHSIRPMTVPGVPDLEEELGWENNYKNVLAACYALLDGSIETNRFEDRLRLVLGSDGYELFTLDRVVALGTKQLNHLAQSSSQALLELHLSTTTPDTDITQETVAGYGARYVELMRTEKESEGFWFSMDGDGGKPNPFRLHVRYLPSIVTVEPAATAKASNGETTVDTTPSQSDSPVPETESGDAQNSSKRKIDSDSGANQSDDSGGDAAESDDNHVKKRTRVESQNDTSESSTGDSTTAPAPAPRTRSLRSRH